MADETIIAKQANGVVLVTTNGNEYTLKPNYRVQKNADNVEIRDDSSGSVAIFTVAEVEKVILADTSEVLIGDLDTLFTQLHTNFFFDGLESNGSIDNFVSAYTTNTQSIAIANTFQPVTFENEIQKDGWNHSNVVDPEDFTCNKSAIYGINIHGVAQKTSGANAFFEVRVTLDGVEVAGSAFGTSLITNGEQKQLGTNLFFSAVAGEVLNIEITAGSTNTEIVVPVGNAVTHVSMKFGIFKIK